MEEDKPHVHFAKSGDEETHQSRGSRGSHFWLTTGGGLLLLLIIAVIVIQGIIISKLNTRLTQIEWDLHLIQKAESRDVIAPEVNVIQFLKRGYSIELEQVSFTQDGLRLTGYLGNPTNIYLHNICLNFLAQKHEAFDEFGKMDKWDRFLYRAGEIGSAQTQAILVIPPGKRGKFEVTIPNVRQTKEGFELRVSFSGERYAYY